MRDSNKSLVLIGMPGCGKTTAGKITASRLKLGFVDMDQYIENMTGCTIPQLFQKGEDYFRDRETEAAQAVSLLPPCVISTGGGIVKRRENMDILKKNGFLVFIDRSTEDIMKDLNAQGRPLLRDNPNAIYALYRERYSLYKEYSDCIVNNTGSLKELSDEIAHLYESACKGGLI